jgi:dimethylglycine dehydrogenase
MTGADVHAFLDRMACGIVPRREGRVGLCYLLNQHGCLKSEATVANLPGGRVWYGSAAAAEYHDMDWLTAHLRDGEDVRIRSLTNDWTILVLAGPKVRAVMSAVSRADWSAAAFPWLSVRECFIGIAPAVVMGVSFSGELAYEIHVPNAHLYAAYRALRMAGVNHGLRLFGSRAVESMRLEKGHLHWKSDILTEFDPFETGLDRFVRMDKGDFIGRAALAERQRRGPARCLVTLAVGSREAPAHGGASVMEEDRVAGTVTSGDWGHRTGLNLAYAFVDPDRARPGTRLEVDVVGMRLPARVIPMGPYDPKNARVRA